ncbi:MAG: radical SAM protein [Endomicrobiales bacterium]|nr:radical SAM protein [Endomicrobiales bacterium]
MIQFTWDIHYKCNYRCPYCWFHGKWDDIACNNVYPGTDRLLSYWENIRKLYGKVHIEISGGEPSIYPDFPKFAAELSKMHDIGVTSNISGNIDGIIGSGAKYNIGMSFHPLFADGGEFLKRAVELKEGGFGNTVLYLAYPPAVKDIPKYKELFEKHGFIFYVLSFWGKYNGLDYPQNYTEEEKVIVNTALGVRGNTDKKFQLEPVSTRGKNCNAGRTYALVHPNGDAYRCGGGNWKEQHQPFGNVFSDGFRLLEGPEPCESDNCPCNEWSFLLVE